MTQLLTDEQISEVYASVKGHEWEPDAKSIKIMRAIEQAVIEAYDRNHHIDLTNERVLSDDLVSEALRLHHLPTDAPSQLADSFKAGMRYAERCVIEAMQKEKTSDQMCKEAVSTLISLKYCLSGNESYCGEPVGAAKSVVYDWVRKGALPAPPEEESK